MTRAQTGTQCPCESGRAYDACCGRWHRGEPAPDAEALMRSRYCAYVLGRDDYLLATWHPSTRPASLDDPERGVPRWLGLEVRQAARAAPDPATPGVERATVEFVARFRLDGRGHRLHETSRFVREAGRWFYVDGDVRA